MINKSSHITYSLENRKWRSEINVLLVTHGTDRIIQMWSLFVNVLTVGMILNIHLYTLTMMMTHWNRSKTIVTAIQQNATTGTIILHYSIPTLVTHSINRNINMYSINETFCWSPGRLLVVSNRHIHVFIFIHHHNKYYSSFICHQGHQHTKM